MVAYRRVLFSSQGPPGIYLTDLDSANYRLILDELPFYDQRIYIPGYLRYSPDGTSLALEIHGEIFLLDIKTGLLRQLTFTNRNAATPAWAPDGRHIVYRRIYYSPPEDSSSIYVHDVVTGEERALLNQGQPLIANDPRWWPGEAIVLTSGMESPLGNPDVFVIQPDGSSLRRLTHAGRSEFGRYPIWIDHSNRIIYLWWTGIGYDTRVMDANGANSTRWAIPLHTQTILSDAISPDGQYVILPDLAPGTADTLGVLFICRLDDPTGETMRQITSYYAAP